MSEPTIQSLTARINTMRVRHGITDEDMRIAKKRRSMMRFHDVIQKNLPSIKSVAYSLEEASTRAGVAFTSLSDALRKFNPDQRRVG